MKSTPGPWRVYQSTSVHPTWVGEADFENGCHAICECLGPDAPANARSIAALPRLMAALQTLVNQRDGHFHTAEAWDEAREALRQVSPSFQVENEA